MTARDTIPAEVRRMKTSQLLDEYATTGEHTPEGRKYRAWLAAELDRRIPVEVSDG